jgi:hypothetical protein
MTTPRLLQVKFTAICFAMVSVPTLQAAGGADARPNIIVIMPDDSKLRNSHP